MFSTVRVLAISALVAMAAASSEAGGPIGLSLFCEEQLGSLMAENQEVGANLQAALQQAKKVLSSPVSEDVRLRSDLSEALSAVAEDQACSKRSIHYVNTIAECRPDLIDGMQMLVEASQRYTQKCFGRSDYWDGRLNKELARLSKASSDGLLSSLMHGKLSSERPNLITDVLDEKFIAEFNRENPRPQGYSFHNYKGEGCCQARKASHVLRSVFEKFIGPVQNTYDYKIAIEKLLFKPCDTYSDFLYDLMDEAMNTATLYPGGESAFVQSRSKSFQEAVFRYMFCSSLGKYLPMLVKIDYIGFQGMN